MLEKALTGSRGYWTWLTALVAVIAIGATSWLQQVNTGLVVTGLGRDVSWGLYIAQFTFLVGVAAAAVMVVLPCYLHDCQAFQRVTILAECLAVAAVACCVLFVLVDLGQPARVLNVILYPTPTSIMFWDIVSLGGYLVLNAIVAWTTIVAERNGAPTPRWIMPVILLSIPWAVSIHTVTAFLYSGLPGRSFWLTALLAPRFLASAFAAGPALLVLLSLLLRRVARFDIGSAARRHLATIVAYAMIANVFFLLMEVFTTFYGQIPEPMRHFQYLYVGLDGHRMLVPWMWLSAALSVVAIVLLVVPRLRGREPLLAVASAAVFVALWIDKGLALVVAGFVPTMVDAVVDYAPTRLEIEIALGIWAVGALMVTVFYKIVVGVREDGAGV